MEGGRRGGGRRAQATVEFAFAAPLFLLCLLAAIDAGLWSVQTSALVAGAENAARIAASAGTTPLGHTAPDARLVTQNIVGQLNSALFATTVVPWCDPAPGAPCAPPATRGVCGGSACQFQTCPASSAAVQAVFGPRVIAVCVHEQDPPPCGTPPPGVATPYPLYCADSPTITVHLIGFIASLVPPGLGVGEVGGELPTDVTATTHTLRFAP